MHKYLVMTVIGPDRTGLVETLAGLIAENHGNWLESRMGRLGGEFAGILRVRVPHANEDALIQALQNLQSQGLTVIVRAESAKAEAPVRAVSLSVMGHDRPGIIHEISAVLARHGVNVEELASECYSAPMSGDLIFRATARLEVPASCDIGKLRDELERIGDELMVDISLREP